MSRPLFRGCHQAAEEQSSQKFNSYLSESQGKQFSDESSLNQAVVRLIVGPRSAKSTTDLGRYLDPWILVKQCSHTGEKRNPAHSGVPGPVRNPGQALGISKGLQHEVQGCPQQPKWTSQACP